MASMSQNNGAAEQTESQTRAQFESPMPILTLSRSIIRPYHVLDAPSIAREANNPLIAQWMRNLFPDPYTLLDAESWISIATKTLPLRNFAITRPDGTYVGGIGLKPLADVESRTMEIGYWIGEAHWGAGIMTEAVIAFSRWSFETIPELLRLEAGIFGGNEGSMAVLRKAGYTFEGRRRNAVFKNGKVLDFHMFALLREECLGSRG
ncbi:acyl-CoA N-acyltransferase [Mycena albidolilacea]|uniref:Acyl-CoA N-acyltransferase n=1 Tax=Mycena albidolilacea TaxID=1033008 RepID=A0AAD7A3E8_9AGAR|nr:acyl-CoA N-acyltransferase [Mycena albidolilacea]